MSTSRWAAGITSSGRHSNNSSEAVSSCARMDLSKTRTSPCAGVFGRNRLSLNYALSCRLNSRPAYKLMAVQNKQPRTQTEVHCRKIKGGRRCARSSNGTVQHLRERTEYAYSRTERSTSLKLADLASDVILHRMTVFHVGQGTEANSVGAFAELERPYRMQETVPT